MRNLVQIGRDCRVVFFGQHKIGSKSIGLHLLCDDLIIRLVRRVFLQSVFTIQLYFALAVHQQMTLLIEKGEPKVIMRLEAIRKLDHGHLSGHPTGNS